MIVKVCGITGKDQFELLEQLKIGMIGLNFYPHSKRYISRPFRGINSRNTAKKVGVFVNQELTYILDKVVEFSLDMVQLHGIESVEYCEEVARHIPLIKAFGVDDDFSFTTTQQYLSCAKYFLFDTKSAEFGGTGKKFNWQKLAEYKYDKPFLLSGGIQLADIPEIISLQHNALAGIDVNSGFELSPGVKDVNKINEILKLINKG